MERLVRSIAVIAGAVWRWMVWCVRNLSRQTRKGTLQAERQRLISRRQDRFTQMGRIVYDMYQQDRVRTKSLLTICEEVRELEHAIEKIGVHEELRQETAPKDAMDPSSVS